VKYEVRIGGKVRRAELARQDAASSRVAAEIDGRRVEADAVEIAPGVYSILIHGRPIEVRVEPASGGLAIHAAGREFRAEIADPRAWRRGHGGAAELEGRQKVVAPMPGKVVRLLAASGAHLEAGQGIAVVEAMKMQNELRSPKSGTLERLLVKEGQPVNAGEVIAVVV